MKLLFLDCEWFIDGEIFLIGYVSIKTNNFNSFTKPKFRYLEKNKLKTIKQLIKQHDYIFVYGPDIGIIESYFHIRIKKNNKCINLHKYFKSTIKGLESYKLAEIEKHLNIKRNVRKYKTNIFTIFRDWNNPRVKIDCSTSLKEL